MPYSPSLTRTIALGFIVVKTTRNPIGNSLSETVTFFHEKWEADAFAEAQNAKLSTYQRLEILYTVQEAPAKPERHYQKAPAPKPVLRRRLTPAQQKKFVQQAGKCMNCGMTDITVLEVHHIKLFAKGGSNQPENLSVLCPTCHKKAQNGQIVPLSFASYTRQIVQSVPVKAEPVDVTHAQLGDRVYNPLIQELASWSDPLQASPSEWKRLQLAERRLVLKVPEKITGLRNEADDLFDKRGKLRTMLHEYVDDTTKSVLVTLGIVNSEDLGSFEFRLMGQPGSYNPLYVSWIWESAKNFKDYVWDIKSKYPQRTQWRLETWVNPPNGGGRLVGRDRETETAINRVLRFLMSQQFAQELLTVNKRIQELGPQIISLIDEELKKG